MEASGPLSSTTIAQLLHSPHPGVLVYLRCTEAMTVLVAANVTAAGASLSLDLVGVGWSDAHP